MRKTHPAVALLTTLLLAQAALAQVIFDANFNAQPLGTLATGSPPDLPQSIITDAGATVEVVNSAGNLTDKPVLLRSVPGSLADVAFFNPTQLNSGKWRVSWDSLVLDTPVNDELIRENVTISAMFEGHGPTVWGMTYLPNGRYFVEDSNGYQTVGGFTVGRSDHFDLDLDLDTRTYRLLVNNRNLIGSELAWNGEFLLTGFASNGRFGEQQPRFAFDNFRVGALPEPAALGLICLAAVPLLRRRRRGRRTLA